MPTFWLPCPGKMNAIAIWPPDAIRWPHETCRERRVKAMSGSQCHSCLTGASQASMAVAMFSSSDLERAQRIVYAAMPPTPQFVWPLLCAETQCEVWVKHENHTPVGAF